MTRSEINTRSWQARKKAMKTTATHMPMGRQTAIDFIRKAEEEHRKHVTTPGTSRRNPGRMDGVRWNGDSFVCNARIDDESEWRSIPYESAEEADWEPEYDWTMKPERREYVVSLVDMAKPMKVKGLAKEYEIVEGCSRVIIWDDYEDFASDRAGDQWEEWEDLFDGNEKILGKSYAEALTQSHRGKH